MVHFNLRVPLSIIVLAAWCAGCSKPSGPEIVPIYGAVTSQGQPVPDLFINFEPVQGRPSWAMTDAAGKYQATYTPDQPGVLAGDCRVWVKVKPKSPQEEQQFMEGTHPRIKELAPLLSKYGRETSPLKLTISAEQRKVDLVLD